MPANATWGNNIAWSMGPLPANGMENSLSGKHLSPILASKSLCMLLGLELVPPMEDKASSSSMGIFLERDWVMSPCAKEAIVWTCCGDNLPQLHSLNNHLAKSESPPTWGFPSSSNSASFLCLLPSPLILILAWVVTRPWNSNGNWHGNVSSPSVVWNPPSFHLWPPYPATEIFH